MASIVLVMPEAASTDRFHVQARVRISKASSTNGSFDVRRSSNGCIGRLFTSGQGARIMGEIRLEMSLYDKGRETGVLISSPFKGRSYTATRQNECPQPPAYRTRSELNAFKLRMHAHVRRHGLQLAHGRGRKPVRWVPRGRTAHALILCGVCRRLSGCPQKQIVCKSHFPFNWREFSLLYCRLKNERTENNPIHITYQLILFSNYHPSGLAQQYSSCLTQQFSLV